MSLYWFWLILGVALIALEIAVPGIYLVWLGGAALIVGMIAYAAPDMSWQWQLALFAVLSVAAVVVAWRFLRRHPLDTEEPNLNLRGQSYVGQVFALDGPMVNGRGRARVDDGLWTVSGPDLPAGARVRVVAAEGTVLKVEKA